MENVDDGYRAGVEFGSIKYETTAVRLPWEITEETIRQNIEGENLENVITNLMTKQVGVDSEDLLINGDESVSKDNPDYDFLKLNTGVKKMILDGGHVVDVSGTGGMDLEMFYKAVASIPNRFNNGNLRWLMSPTRAQQWELFLLEKITEKVELFHRNFIRALLRFHPCRCQVFQTMRLSLQNRRTLLK